MEIARHWRLKAQRYRMGGSTCPICGRPTFPPRPVCHRCAALLAPIAGYGAWVLPTSKRTLATVSLERRIG